MSDELLIEDEIKCAGRPKVVFEKFPEVIPKNEKGQRLRKIDLNEIERLAELLYSKEDIAKALHIGHSTLTHNQQAVDAFKAGQAKAYHALESAIYKSAITGNVAAQIFLAKNYLGMSDKMRVQSENITIIIEGDDVNL